MSAPWWKWQCSCLAQYGANKPDEIPACDRESYCREYQRQYNGGAPAVMELVTFLDPQGRGWKPIDRSFVSTRYAAPQGRSAVPA